MTGSIVVAAMYRFATLDNFTELRAPLHRVMLDNQVKGTLLLAREGINGTVAGSRAGWMRCSAGCEQIRDWRPSM
jgi:UPF0176 protein